MGPADLQALDDFDSGWGLRCSSSNRVLPGFTAAGEPALPHVDRESIVS
jgi:hypothetical protein